jgi:hypothetical protein
MRGPINVKFDLWSFYQDVCFVMRERVLVRVDVKRSTAVPVVCDACPQGTKNANRCQQWPAVQPTVRIMKLTYPVLSSYDIRCVRWVEALQNNNVEYLTQEILTLF